MQRPNPSTNRVGSTPNERTSSIEDRPFADLLFLLINEVRSFTTTLDRSAKTIGCAVEPGTDVHGELDEMIAATERLRRAADGANDLTSIRIGQIELARDSFSPSQLLHEVVADIGSTDIARGVEFGLRVDSEVPHKVAGDRERLRIVLEEVIGLALPLSAEGRVHIEVATQTDGRLRFRVHSTKDERSSILDQITPWNRATGGQIGLALARQLIELMDGSLGYETNERGTAFWFDAALSPARRLEDRRLTARHHQQTSPVADASTTFSPAEAASTPTPTSTPTEPSEREGDTADDTGITEPESDSGHSHRTLHVLVVDDSDVNRLLATSQLDRLGHTHETARSGLAALDLMSTVEFDAVLMDWHMPGMNGLEATQRWREQHDPDHRLPIITMTASAMTGDRERCIEAGASDYLSKPVSINDLGSMLTRWCRRNETTPDVVAEANGPLTKIDELIADLGDASVVHSIVEAFLDMVPQYRSAATAALAVGDRSSIRRHAHTLKSTAIMLGTGELAAACIALEAAASSDTGDLDDAVAEFSRCCREAELALIDLSALLVSQERAPS